MNDSTLSVLIVDDDELTTELFGEILSKRFEVLIAHNIHEAQQICCNSKLGVVLSDYHIGMQTADVLFDWLANTQPELIKRFILLTGDQLSDLSRYQDAATVLYKPVPIDTLLSVVERAYQGDVHEKMEA